MAKRVYGGVAPVKKPVESNTVTEYNVVVESESKENQVEKTEKPKKVKSEKSNKGPIIAMVIAIVLLIIAVGRWFYIFIYDTSNGASTPEKAAIGFVKALDSSSSEDMLKYVPKEIREDGFGSDIDEIQNLRTLDENYDITMKNIQVVGDVESLSGSVEALSKGLENVYGKSVNIKDAKCVHISSIMTYSLPNEDGTSEAIETNLEFDFICIKVNMKWYIYTASDLGATKVETDDKIDMSDISEDTTTEENQTSTDATEVSDNEIEIEAPDEKIDAQTVELDFYNGAKDDLQAGKLKINDVEYTMPAKYQDMTGLFELIDDSLDKDDRVVKPNYILKTLPVWFINKDYQMTDLTVSIANNTTKNIDLAEGVVTTLYIAPVNPYDYPYVYLPGNVTFGTSYSDVEKMYGEKSLIPFKDEDKGDIIKHSSDAKIYEMKLNNVHNHVYLSFEDDKLVAIQYYYYDLGDFIVDTDAEGE